MQFIQREILFGLLEGIGVPEPVVKIIKLLLFVVTLLTVCAVVTGIIAKIRRFI